MEERQLVSKLKQRDEKAFAQLVRSHQSRVFNTCLRILCNAAEAEDIAQDVFVRAFRSIDAFRGDAALNTWLHKIAVNLCKNRIKYHTRRQRNAHSEFNGHTVSSELSRPDAPMSEASPTPDEALAGRRAQSRVLRALEMVEAEFRELLVLRDIQGMTYGEIMQITSLPQGTVKSRLHRARKALKSAYDLQEESP